MEIYWDILLSAPLFQGIERDELSAVLSCLDAKTERYEKGAFLLRVGETVESIGLMMSGSVLILQEDIWGNRSILSKAEAGQTFAAAFACAPHATLNVSVMAETPVTVLMLNVRRILTVCSSACTHHSRIIRNLVAELADKSLRCNEKLTHLAQRTTRAKLLSFLSAEAQRRGCYAFDLPFSRQQLADYLSVDRSGLSVELGKMQTEGLIEVERNHFVIKM